MPNKLEEARKIINEVDAQMAELFVKRMRAAELVCEHKMEHGLPILDQKREDAVIEQNAARIQDEVLKEYYIDYLKHVMAVSRAYQHRLQSGLKVAYSGVEGAFAHIAADRADRADRAESADTVTVSLPARAPHSYDVTVGPDLRRRAGELMAGVHAPCRVLLLTDDTVEALYADEVTASLTEAGYAVLRHVIPHGEASKSGEKLLALLEKMAAEQLTRADLLVALGGGVVGDLGGFAAAVYQRGIPFVQMPTTLLAMVDASVGGKTAIDLAAGKNLCGAFHQPSLVICDTACLDTLPPAVFADGMAEVIKYAFINDAALYELLQAENPDMTEIIRRCVEDKRALVEADETDKGVRQLLNLGHTVGHAVEACSGYAVSHGSAVAMGMAIMTRAAELAGICQGGTTAALLALLDKYGLSAACPFTVEELNAAALSDKKRSGGFLTLVVPYGVADARLVTVPADALEGYIRAGLSD